MSNMHRLIIHLIVGLVLLLSLTTFGCAKPAQFKVSDVAVMPAEVALGETATVTANIENVGGGESVYSAVLIVDGQEFERKDVTVSPQSSKGVTFELVGKTVGTHKVKLGVISKTLIVKEAQKEPVLTTTSTVKVRDLGDDFFDKDGNPVAGDPFLDILETELSFSGGRYTFKIKLNGQLPAALSDPSTLLEWDVLLDTDCSASTGWNWPLVCNNIGPDYLVRVLLQGSTYKGAVLDIKAQKWGDIGYNVDKNVLLLNCAVDTIGKPLGFDYIVVSRKYRGTGDQQELVIADKSPNVGRYAFPDGDGDTYCDYIEKSVYGTDPQVAEKWDDVDTVGHILNTPEKVSLWLSHEFVEVARPGTRPVDQIFHDKWGDCDEFAMLATYWLAQNGYESNNLIMDINKWWEEYNTWIRHYVCAYKGKDGLWHSIDLYFRKSGNPAGPFNSIEAILSSVPPHYGGTDWVYYELHDSNMRLLKTTARTPTPTTKPTSAPTSTPTPIPGAKSVKLTDPHDDSFDKLGNPITDQPYLDIVEAEVTTSGSNYVVRINLNGSLPSKTPDSQIFLEWGIYVDADCNPSTGSPWPIITSDIGPEYLVRLMLLDSNYSSEARELRSGGQPQKIEYRITGNTIELYWPQSFYQSNRFNFVAVAKKYGERGAASAFVLADKAPNQGHGQFP